MENITEEWRPVPGYEGLYDVSSLGRVRSIGRKIGHNIPGYTRVLKSRILKPTLASHGYLTVKLHCERKGLTKTVHSIVAEAFIGPRPDGLDVCHNNGNRCDNRACNLRYDTRKNNFQDALLHGTRLRGERQNGAILKPEDVLFIRGSKELPAVLAEKYGVSKQTIYDVRARRSWAHLP